MAGLLPQGKLHFLFSLLPPNVVAQLSLDEVACFSVTDARTARQTTRLLLRLPRPLHRLGAVPIKGLHINMAMRINHAAKIPPLSSTSIHTIDVN